MDDIATVDATTGGGKVLLARRGAMKPPDNINKVFNTIWIGGAYALRNSVLSECGIAHVLNTSAELLNPGTPVDWADLQLNGIHIQHILWSDDYSQQIYPFEPDVHAALRFIHQCVIQNENVLVNCSMGISRSCSMVVAYLITYQQQTVQTALALIRNTRPHVSPNASFLEQLRQLESTVSIASAAATTTTPLSSFVPSPHCTNQQTTALTPQTLPLWPSSTTADATPAPPRKVPRIRPLQRRARDATSPKHVMNRNGRQPSPSGGGGANHPTRQPLPRVQAMKSNARIPRQQQQSSLNIHLQRQKMMMNDQTSALVASTPQQHETGNRQQNKCTKSRVVCSPHPALQSKQHQTSGGGDGGHLPHHQMLSALTSAGGLPPTHMFQQQLLLQRGSSPASDLQQPMRHTSGSNMLLASPQQINSAAAALTPTPTAYDDILPFHQPSYQHPRPLQYPQQQQQQQQSLLQKADETCCGAIHHHLRSISCPVTARGTRHAAVAEWQQ